MVINKKSRKEGTLKKILKAPLRILARARDFYIKGMAEYSDQVCVMSCPTGNFNTMPRSYSVSSTKPNHLDDDRREPLRAASTRSNLGSRNSKINVDVPARQQYSHKKSATRLGDRDGAKQSNIKQRRMAKRVATKERLKSSIVETAVQDQTLRSPAQATCDKI
ncbi:hypothetical protein Peur_060371 [Populus x canadensis]